jgi:AcrR family transcriptional regulator
MTVKEAMTRRGAESEQAMLDAARDILAERGLEGLSMRSVADRVGVTATAIYRYFPGKEALVSRVVERGFQRFGEYLRDAGERHPHGSLERINALGEAYLRFALENQAYFRVLFSLDHSDRQAIEDLPDGGGHGLLRRAVVEAMEAGVMRRADPETVAMYLWSVTHGLVTLSLTCRIDECPEFRHGPVTGPVDLFAAFGSFVRDGLATRAAGPGGERNEGGA